MEKNRRINQDLCAMAWDEIFGEILDKVEVCFAFMNGKLIPCTEFPKF
jgi:hypothetical protein